MLFRTTFNRTQSVMLQIEKRVFIMQMASMGADGSWVTECPYNVVIKAPKETQTTDYRHWKSPINLIFLHSPVDCSDANRPTQTRV